MTNTDLHGKGFKLFTLGCKVNQCETQLLRERLEAAGLRESEPGKTASLCIVNTCAVTSVAQGKSARALRKMKKENPGAIMVAIGCGVSAAPERFDEADMVIEQKDKDGAVERILGVSNTLLVTSRFEGHARAFLKIQDGCDSFCSYCIVPYLRGEPRSKTLELILEEARNIAGKGYGELVLTGIHLGIYGRDIGTCPSLAGVVRRLLDENLFPRIRLSGVECTEVTDELISLITSDNALCPHLHIALQSGSAKVLGDMNRGYSPGDYIAVIRKIREKAPMTAITTDIITGFPAESEADFTETLDICEKVEFSRIHVFPYSRRGGTAAAQRWKSGSGRQASIRASRLREKARELAEIYARQFVGEKVRVLVESKSRGRSVEGYTDHYVRARIDNFVVDAGTLVEGIASGVSEGLLVLDKENITIGERS